MERDVGFAASFGDGDVGNTNFVGQFDHRRLPYFFEQFRNGEATNAYMQSVTFAHHEFKVATQVFAYVKFRKTLGTTSL